MRAFIKGLVSGLLSLLDLFRFAGRNRRMMLTSGLLAAGLQLAGLYYVWFQLQLTASWWNVFVQIAGTLAVLLLAPYLMLLLVQILIPAVADKLFFAGLDRQRPAWSDEFRLCKAPSLFVTAGRSLGRLGMMLGGWILFALIGMIPVLTVFATLGGWIWSTWFVVVELADPYVDRRGTQHSSRVAARKELRWALLGYGLPVVAGMSLPLIGPFFWGSAQAGIARILPTEMPVKTDTAN